MYGVRPLQQHLSVVGHHPERLWQQHRRRRDRRASGGDVKAMRGDGKAILRQQQFSPKRISVSTTLRTPLPLTSAPRPDLDNEAHSARLRNSSDPAFGRVPALSAASWLRHPRRAPTAHRSMSFNRVPPDIPQCSLQRGSKGCRHGEAAQRELLLRRDEKREREE